MNALKGNELIRQINKGAEKTAIILHINFSNFFLPH